MLPLPSSDNGDADAHQGRLSARKRKLSHHWSAKKLKKELSLRTLRMVPLPSALYSEDGATAKCKSESCNGDLMAEV